MTVAALLRGARVDRWRRVALASVKQSRRAVVPEIRMPLTLRDAARRTAAALRLMLVEPARRRGRRAAVGAFRTAALRRRRAAVVAPKADGPRGACRGAQRGVRLVTLGHRTLRADAVPVAAISVLQFSGEISSQIRKFRICHSNSDF